MYRKKIAPIITFLTFLLLIACTEESTQITTPQNKHNSDDIIGTWMLTEIQYQYGGNTITALPENSGISMTLKFYDSKTGQMISIENGSNRIDTFIWNYLGPVVEIIDQDGDWESLRCEIIESKMYIEHGFEIEEGNIVLASYVFEKEAYKSH